MTDTITSPQLGQSGVSAEYVDAVISFNVKIRLAARGLSQTVLGEALGIRRASMSQKMTGRSSWSASDLVNTATFLDTSAADLLDDTLMKKMGVGRDHLTAADTRPRYVVMPSDGEVCPGCDSNARHLL